MKMKKVENKWLIVGLNKISIHYENGEKGRKLSQLISHPSNLQASEKFIFTAFELSLQRISRNSKENTFRTFIFQRSQCRAIIC